MSLLKLFVSPAYAIDSKGIKDSLNQGFNDQLNILNIALVIIFIFLIVFIIRVLSRQEEEKAARKRLFDFKLKKSDSKRQFYRAPLKIEIRWSLAGNGKNVFHIAEAVNLSGGGLRFRTNELLEPGQEILVHLDFGEDDSLTLPSKVLRIEPITLQEQNMYEVAVQFEHLSARKQDKIIAYVMNFEREHIKNVKYKNKQENGEDDEADA